MNTNHRTLSFPAILGTFVLILLFALAVAGCGTTSAGASGSTPTSVATKAATQKCGTIGVRPGNNGNVTLPGDTQADTARNCFWQAYQQCQPASLTVSFGGIDTITTHNFTLQKKDTTCTISDAVQHRVVPQPAKNVGTFTCSGLVNTTSELHFRSCGTTGDVVIPIAKS